MVRRLKLSQQIKYKWSVLWFQHHFLIYHIASSISGQCQYVCILALNRCLLLSNELLYVSRTGGHRCVTIATSLISDLTGNAHSNQA